MCCKGLNHMVSPFSWSCFRLHVFADLLFVLQFVILKIAGVGIQRLNCFKAFCIRFFQNRLPTLMEGLALDKYIYCCGFKQLCKVYDLPTNFGVWKKFYFIDECAVCKRSVAVIQLCTEKGEIKTLKRCSGRKAVELRNKLTLKVLTFNNIAKGTLEDERRYYNNFGIIYNFNNKRIGTNEDFCKKSKEVL